MDIDFFDTLQYCTFAHAILHSLSLVTPEHIVIDIYMKTGKHNGTFET